MTTNSKPISTTKTEVLLPPRCDRKRCLNNAELFPIMVMPAPKWSHNPKAKMQMELSMNVCPKHAIDDVDQFVDDTGWQQIRDNFASRRMVIPDRKLVNIVFCPLKERRFA